MANYASQFINTISVYWNRIVNIGVFPGMPFIEVRRTKLLNLMSLPGVPFTFYFMILNITQGRYILALINLLIMCGSLGVLYFNKRQHYLSARLWLILYNFSLYTLSGLFFHNGCEFFLLNILFLVFLIYDDKWLLAGLCIMVVTGFMVVHFLPVSWSVADPVPSSRIAVNVFIALVFMIIALVYFKSIHEDYQEKTESQRLTLDGLNRDKEKLFSIIAHDIRSPLATLEVLLDMFTKGEYPEAEMKIAALTLNERVKQVGGTLDNLLQWSAAQMKGIATTPVSFALSPLVVEILQLFESNIQEKKLEVNIDLPQELMTYADKDQVVVIVRNLLGNAIKFSHSGGSITLAGSESEDNILFRVADKGVGIAPDKIASLFTFKGMPAYGTAGERGAGLGLMLCNEFAMQNGGAIEVESEIAKGSIFTLILPRSNGQETEDFF
jgi:two-component system sensor histidine kinase/response regulator